MRNVCTLMVVLFSLSFSAHASHEAFDKNYMIVTQGEASSLAAREMFEKGGNVIDAAAAASFALAVERPQSTGIGGGGFMLIRLQNQPDIMAVDFREKAPLRATERMFQDKTGNVIPHRSTQGIYAAAVPGMVAGVLAVHEKFGRLPRQDILAPAIHLAKTGIRVYPHLAKAIETNRDLINQFPASRKLFLHPSGDPLQVGDLLVQPELAKTLETIATKGRDGFYSGSVAGALLAEQRRQHGLISQQDLDAYQATWRTPIHGTYKGYDIYSMPPPSSGGTHIVQILNMIEGLRLSKPYSAESIHRTASAMQLAFADRAKYLGDPDFISVPIQGLTSKAYAAELRKKIGRKAKQASEIQAGDPLPYESQETTHFTIADREGNIVSSTQTINGWLGSGIVVPGAGFLLNNEMDDFSAKPGVPNKFGLIGGKENAIVPGKRPLSSMSPTIVTKDNQPVMALGSPAGSMIISCVTLTLLNSLEYKMPLFDAIKSLRYHHQWLPDELQMESPGFSKKVTRQLEHLGYCINPTTIGCKVEAVAFEGDKLHGAADPRGEGLAIGEKPPPGTTVSPIDVQRD
ncbi:MAG: gamma-glutamyltransferase [Deltaproteobacteria bacterium]|nr:gamma-glutamyltransferase [Deltaproteobacteria bacterium]